MEAKWVLSSHNVLCGAIHIGSNLEEALKAFLIPDSAIRQQKKQNALQRRDASLPIFRDTQYQNKKKQYSGQVWGVVQVSIAFSTRNAVTLTGNRWMVHILH